MTEKAPEQNRAIELHDSYLGRIERVGNSIELHFEPAYIHQSVGRPGFEPGTGWVQNAMFTLDNATAEGPMFDLPADLSDGTLEVDGSEVRDLLAVPSEYSGQIVLTLLDKKSGETMLFRCSRLTLRTLGEARYVEEVP